MFSTIVNLQHEFNKQVAVDYLDKGFGWNSAIIAESGELLDSLGYKWWKKQEPDMDNVKVEAIDLLHFVISESIQKYHSRSFPLHKAIENTCNNFEGFFTQINHELISSDLEELVSLLNYDNCNRFFILKQIFKQLGMSNEDVYIAYIVKNCLNKFRQEHGYKTGEYIKDWNGKEDNVVAYEIANEWGADEDLFEQLYIDLCTYYDEEVLKGAICTTK
ncbi:dUTP diphosphatase [Aliarcobacter butzleri]|uniref:dUTP diphosphatase n=1 Tax=Aliarcobacter butzleri TaxID=28197 RepID=UPI003AFAAEB3